MTPCLFYFLKCSSGSPNLSLIRDESDNDNIKQIAASPKLQRWIMLGQLKLLLRSYDLKEKRRLKKVMRNTKTLTSVSVAPPNSLQGLKSSGTKKSTEQGSYSTAGIAGIVSLPYNCETSTRKDTLDHMFALFVEREQDC